MSVPVKTSASGFSLPVLGIGTAHMGGSTREASHENDEVEVTALKQALSLGYTHIDTAALYAEGHAEELVGEAIRDFDRESLVISTKVWKDNLVYDEVIASANASLERLGISDIDLYCIHAPSDEVSIEETCAALNELYSQGIIKNIGVSNFTVAELIEAQQYLDTPIVTNQFQYSLLVREKSHFHGLTAMESEILPYCQKNGILVTATVPLARGSVTEENQIMKKLAERHNKTYAQIAINWLISQPQVVTIVKAANHQHIEENLGSVGWKLAPEEIERLRLHYPSDRSTIES